MSAKGDRTEAPTPKRKRDSRKKGQVAKSLELVMWTQLFAATILIQFTIKLASKATTDLIRETGRIMQNPDPAASLQLFAEGGRRSLIALVPIALGGMAIAIAGNLAQTGLLLATHRLKPSTERLNPFKGIKRMLSGENVNEQLRSSLRLVILAYVVWSPLWSVTRRVVANPTSLTELAMSVGSDGIALARRVALVGVLFGVVDYAFQRRKLMKQIRMTKQELKDEYRSTEGDPLVRSQRRSRQMEMSRNRMMNDVAGATAVIVNPTHIAVAIKYNPVSGAPRVVAKGSGPIAARIRLEAERHGVPIVREVGLARALNSACQVGQEIPVELYEAVARLLAFVFSVGRRVAWAGPLTIAGPPLVPVPPDRPQGMSGDADDERVARRVTARRAQGRPRRSEVT